MPLKILSTLPFTECNIASIVIITGTSKSNNFQLSFGCNSLITGDEVKNLFKGLAVLATNCVSRLPRHMLKKTSEALILNSNITTIGNKIMHSNRIAEAIFSSYHERYIYLGADFILQAASFGSPFDIFYNFFSNIYICDFLNGKTRAGVYF